MRNNISWLIWVPVVCSSVLTAQTKPASSSFAVAPFLEPNVGQFADDDVIYAARVGKQVVLVARDGLRVVSLPSGAKRVTGAVPPKVSRATIRFVGGALTRHSPIGEPKCHISYYRGAPDNWHSAVPLFEKVLFEDV